MTESALNNIVNMIKAPRYTTKQGAFAYLSDDDIVFR
jgi:hypothetical protein